MNDKPAAAGTRAFEPLDVDLREIPGQSQLFLDFLYSTDKLSGFFPGAGRDPAEFAEEVLRVYGTDRERLCEVLDCFNRRLGSGERSLANIERLRGGNCVAVVTGQQAGIFTGPAYTVYKAISAIVLAERLTREGIEAVPVFWIASEDHDLDEVSSVWAMNEDGMLLRASYTDSTVDGDLPVSEVRFDLSIGGVLDEFLDSLPPGRYCDKGADLLRGAYREGESFSDAFGRVIAALFGERGLVLVSPMETGIRELLAPYAARVLENVESVRRSLFRREEELAAGGYHSQVYVGEEYFPFFFLDSDRRRRALRFDGETVSTKDGEASFTIAELLARLEEDPGCLSPNALVRPLLQDCLFPTVCYYGGSAEIAYFAQNSSIYEALGMPVTPIRHRNSFTIVDPGNQRTINRYGLSLRDIPGREEATRARIVSRDLDSETAGAFKKGKSAVASALDELEAALAKSDPTLEESLIKRRKKMQWHLETLERKFFAAGSRRDETVERRLRKLFHSVWPHDGLQERTLNIFQFVNAYGMKILEWLEEAAEPERKDHRFLIL